MACEIAQLRTGNGLISNRLRLFARVVSYLYVCTNNVISLLLMGWGEFEQAIYNWHARKK